MGSGPAVVVAAGPFYKNPHRWAVWPSERAALPKESIANAFRVEIRLYSVRQTCYNGCK